MANSSPASIRSQAYDFRRTVDLLPMKGSDQEFRSQVPFQTQVPYDPSPFEVRRDGNLPSISRPTVQSIPRSNGTRTGSQELQTSWSKGKGLETQGLPEAQDQYPSRIHRGDATENVQPAAVSRKVRIAEDDNDEDEDETTSSDGSIECESLERLTAESPTDADPKDIPATQGQPFPLVEWIRRIREESKPEFPMLPLKWARSISKQQKAILDSDDAWYPPLPGRPFRQGTIPIDILTELTRKVDQDAEMKAKQKLQPSHQGLGVNSQQHTRASQPQNVPSSPPDADADVPWSSSPPSPPRRLLPPDTSPPRPTSGQGQQPTSASEISHQTSQDVPATSRDSLTNARRKQQSRPNRSSQIEPSQYGPSVRQERGEDESAVAVDELPDVRTLPQEKPPTSPMHEDLPATRSGRNTRPPDTITFPRPRIQVKDTPYPPKRPLQDRHRYQASDDIPQSSLVAGTYPDAFTLDRRKENLPEREICSASRSPAIPFSAPQSGSQFVPVQSQRPERSLKRAFDKVDELADKIAARTSPRDRVNRPVLNNDNDSQSERGLGEVDTKSTRKRPTHSTGSPTCSEYKAEEEMRLRNKELLDIARLEKRRAFRASISTSVVRDGVKHRMASKPQALNEDTRAISPVPSSPKSNGPTVAGSRSEGDNTSATNLSLHDMSRATKPSSRNVPRQVLVQVSGKSGGLEEMFQSFTQMYSDYLGNFKNFESAIRLLIKLRSKPREPHPSLWDDFVFRMADDYKVYLQECIEEAESALPYQDFYYENVKQPEHNGGIITAEILKIATSSTAQAIIPLKRSSSNLPNHTDTVMVDADTSDSQSSRELTTRSNVGPARDLQDVRDDVLLTKANRTPVLQKPDKVPSHQPSSKRVNIDAAIKRQSVPWSSSKPLRDSVMLQTQQIIASSSEQTNTTTAVEQWLSRPAGACSPEMESTQIQPPEQEIVEVPSLAADILEVAKKMAEPSHVHVHDSDRPKLRLTGYLATSKAVPTKDVNTTPDPLPSATASDVTAQAERAVTPFTLFARNFANLQTEKSFRSLSAGERRLPVNVYEW